jgi:integrase
MTRKEMAPIVIFSRGLRMPRLLNSVPTYRKHRASGQAVVTIAGRDHYLGPHGTKASHAAYDRLVGEWLASNRSPCFNQPESQLTVNEIILGFWHHLKVEFKAKKHQGEFKSLKYALRDLKTLYGSTPAIEFGPLQLKAIQHRFIENGWSRNYVNAQTKRICRVFKFAAAEGQLPAAIYESLRLVPAIKPGRTEARENEAVLPIADDIVERTIIHCNQIVADMVRLQRYCGSRPQEIVSLKAGDIDRTGEVWTAEIRDHKTSYRNKKRFLYFGPKSQAILQKYLDRKPEAFLFSPAEAETIRRSELSKNRKTPLSCGNKPGTNKKRSPQKTVGNCYTVDSYRRSIHYACKKAGVEVWSPNRLRHSAATEVRSKFGLDAASALLGHSDLAITTTYAELDAQKAKSVALEIG